MTVLELASALAPWMPLVLTLILLVALGLLFWSMWGHVKKARAYSEADAAASSPVSPTSGA